MKKLINIKIALFFLALSVTHSCYSDTLGRLFTTPEQRTKLEKIRHAKPKKEPVIIEVVEVEEVIEPIVEVPTVIIERDPIRLQGLVSRSDGKNTAWVNDSSTLKGGLESEYMQIPNNKITKDKVTVILSDDGTTVDIKVGDVYVPEPIEK